MLYDFLHTPEMRRAPAVTMIATKGIGQATGVLAAMHLHILQETPQECSRPSLTLPE